MKNVPPMTVSPAAGRRSVRMTISVLELPTTRILCVAIGSTLLLFRAARTGDGGAAALVSCIRHSLPPLYRSSTHVPEWGTDSPHAQLSSDSGFPFAGTEELPPRLRSSRESTDVSGCGTKKPVRLLEPAFAWETLRLIPDICGRCGAAWRAKWPLCLRTAAKCRPK